MGIPQAGKQLDDLIRTALGEDTGAGDITSEILVPARLHGAASLLVKEEGVLAGREVAAKVFLRVDPGLELELLIEDGSRIRPGDIVGHIRGRVKSILKGERTALNFLQHLSGIATATSKYVDQVKDLPVSIVDTRKTTPGLRLLEKYAVRMGGGRNHRLHMGDAVLIKDNHLAIMAGSGATLRDVVAKARKEAPTGMVVEVEITSADQAGEALEGGADMIMLDNMALEDMARAVKLINHRARVEASGGIRLENVRRVALTGVDIISIGALTHSARALDISLELDRDSIRAEQNPEVLK